MTTSFATYASQFLTRQRSGGASSLTSSQPLFFSFSTDDDRSRAGHEVQAELDDLDDPHLRASDGAGMSSTQRYALDDPYLQLDEDERSHGLSAPLLASHAQSDIPDENEPSRGWLAHQPTALRTPSPPSPSPPPSSSSSSRSPPPDFLNTHRQPPPPTRGPPMQPPLSSAHPPPQSIAVQLTESLLPRDNTHPASIFSLPDPRFPAPRRKYHDPLYTTLFLSAVSLVYFFALLLLFITNSKPRRLPYQTLLHTVPLLVILTFVSAAVSYTHIMLLRVFVKPVVVGTSVFIPVTLFISSIWSFVGSFMWDGDEPTWGETWGLRLFSLVPLALAVITGRRLVHLPAQVQHTSSLLTLTTRVLSLQPLLLLLSPSVLLAFLLASIPFLTLAFRLLLIGYTRSTPTGVEYHVKVWANWAIAATAGVWVWSWGVARGLCRATTAGVVAAWYFADPTLPPPPPQSTHTIHAALYRATHPSLGTIAFAALLLTCVRALSSIAFLLRRAPAYLPLPVKVYAGPLVYGMGIAAGYIENWVDRFGRYVLIYVGITGTGFWASVGRSTGLTAIDKHAEAWRRRFQTDPPLTLLTVTPLTLTLPFALSTYLFVAHTLNAPDQALEAAFLAGGVTALVGLFCVGLVKDTADTLYLCYCIDKEAGERRRAEVFEMFEFGVRNGGGGSAQTRAPHPPPPPPAAPQPHAGQPISRRVEEMYSPGSSPGLGGTRVLERSMPVAAAVTTLEAASTAEDIDPFLRAESSDEEEDDGPVSGYSVHMDDEDENASVSEDEGRAGMSTRMIGSSGRDAEEGLGSGLGGLFPGSDMF